MVWRSFSGTEIEALTAGPAFAVQPGERPCPACGAHSVRAYLSSAPRARRPTLVSWVWCAACRRFVGTRTAHPAGLTFTDPLAGADRRALEASLTGFLDHLDGLWEDGVLPQAFAGSPAE